MKKFILITTFIAIAFAARSQSASYNAFKVDIGFGYAIPASGYPDTKGGATFTIEPQYRIVDAFAVGLRLEGAGLSYKENSLSNSDLKIAALISYDATAEYYFLNGSFRPFIGGGLGFYHLNEIRTDSNTSGVIITGGTTKFGFVPEVGFESGRLRISADYNVLPNNTGYFAVKIGFFAGGNKK